MRKEELQTPVYLMNEQKLIYNLELLNECQTASGAKILLAQKAFSAFHFYPLIAKYLSGTTASGLYEARLAAEEFAGQNHVYSPAYTGVEMKELCSLCDHISFNSLRQLELHRKQWEKAGISVGLRINPEYSTQTEPLYDPCAPKSRLGIRWEELPEQLPRGVEGLHIHTLCEQGFEPLYRTFRAVEERFGTWLHQVKWLNLGGGHHITRADYDRKALVSFLQSVQNTYGVELFLEPGEAVALDAGSLRTTVLDVVYNELPVLILDSSAACHMPDVLEMPYRPTLQGAGLPGERRVTCRLAGRTCLAGDIIGDYSFDVMPAVGDQLEFGDMAIYTMVKNNTFNGMPLPDIAVQHPDGDCELLRSFGYRDFKERLS